MLDCFRFCCFSYQKANRDNTSTTTNNERFPNGIQDSQCIIDSLQYLKNIELNNTVPFLPLIKYGKVVKVYDGDTLTIASRLDAKNADHHTNHSPKREKHKCHYKDLDSGPIYRYQVRLRGIDAPEMRTKDPKEKEQAIKAQLKLSELVLGKLVRLEDLGSEKYGRLLCHVYVCETGVNLSGYMLESKLAVIYDGGTKEKFKSSNFENVLKTTNTIENNNKDTTIRTPEKPLKK